MCEVIDVEDAHLSHASHQHSYSHDEVMQFRSSLLSWFQSNARILPWRASAVDDLDRRAYGVWVSEVMLQQTRVATVIDYWVKWMKRWPTVAALASATLEEVHEAWAGLGYYQRAGRLLDGAKLLMSDYKGCLPRTSESLQKIPGIGPYTAVDGNVIRVLARHRAICASPKHAPFVKHCWKLATSLVDPHRPGKFNEALMELGATVCTPQNPLCIQCPVRSLCKARELCASPAASKSTSTTSALPSSACELCETVSSLPSSVSDFPLKAVKPEPRPIWTACALIELNFVADERLFLLQQRPASGLLANLWEFPGITHDPAPATRDSVAIVGELTKLLTALRIPLYPLISIGETFHQFSHRSQDITAFLLSLPRGSVDPASFTGNLKWLSRAQIEEAAVSKGVHKCLELLDDHHSGASKRKKPKKSTKKENKMKAGQEEGLQLARPKKKQHKIDVMLPPKKVARVAILPAEVIVIDDD